MSKGGLDKDLSYLQNSQVTDPEDGIMFQPRGAVGRGNDSDINFLSQELFFTQVGDDKDQSQKRFVGINANNDEEDSDETTFDENELIEGKMDSLGGSGCGNVSEELSCTLESIKESEKEKTLRAEKSSNKEDAGSSNAEASTSSEEEKVKDAETQTFQHCSFTGPDKHVVVNYPVWCVNCGEKYLDGLYRCQWCEYETSNRYNMRAHMDFVHGEPIVVSVFGDD